MSNDELKEAVRLKYPVTCNGKIYECIEEIVIYYRNGWHVSAVLKEKDVNAVYRVQSEEVQKA